ncbi:MAG: type VI secretion system tip protein VgrG [Polyangiaceae bacterium]|nr:type VI secretion system tip protein VgrG [Polyangiaceae bacterium]
MSDLITIASSALPGTARVVGFHGIEAISRPYQIEIFVTVPSDDDFDADDAIGAKAALTIDRADDDIPPFSFAGVLATVELLHEHGGRALIRAVLVPRLWQLGLSRHSRVFTNKSAPEVIEAILDDNGLTDYELRLQGSYDTEEHITQYRESDLDFISRWMEREGIYYFFEHTEDGEKLVLCDTISYPAEALGKPVRYHPQLGQDQSAGPSFRSFSSRHTTLPAAVKLKDYDYARPGLDVSGAADVAFSGAGEVSLYGERFFTPAAGKRLAKLRAEELLARQVTFQATGTRLHLRSGHTFELDDHPRHSLNARYLAIEVRHHGNQATGHSHFREIAGLEHDDVYFVELAAIPATTQFRAESRTAWPRIYGYENGNVDGPAFSEYAQIDAQGRYLARFKFDEATQRSGPASTFVRMMQPHGGGIEGFHFPLRKGTEVVFSFLGGDPDRPVISGVVPNAVTPSPVTSGNHTKNVIQTGGRNRLEIEDLAGQQRITLSTPYANTYLRMGSPNDGHELIAKTDDRGLVDVGKTLEVYSGEWRKDHVKSGYFNTTVDGTVTDTFNGTHTTTIKNKVTETYNEGHETTVNAALRNATYNVGQLTTVNGGYATEYYNTGHWTEVKGGQTLKVEGGQWIDVKGNQTIAIETDKTETISGKYDLTVTGPMNLTVNGTTKVELKGPQEKIVHGPFNRLYKSENVNVTAGFKSDTFLGLSNSNFLGGQINLTAALQFEAAMTAKLSFTYGAYLAYKFGFGLTISSSVEVTVGLSHLDSKAAKVENLPACLGMHAIRWHTSGTHVIL